MINASEKLALRLREALGDHNDENLGVVQIVKQLKASNKELLEALHAVMESGNDIDTEGGSLAMSKADRAITNAKQGEKEGE